jgi:elongation factor G
MKVYNTNQIKNFALLGNTGSGKTTLAEAMLFEGKVIERRGEVENKNTVSDYSDIERENGKSVYATALYAEYNDKKLNFIDTSGSDDFINGAVAALTVTDVGVLVVNAQNGIEVGTEIHSRYLEKAKKSAVLVINQLDHEKAHFEKVIEEAKERLDKNKITVVQYPLNEGTAFDTIIDVLLMKKISFAGGKTEISEIPADQKAHAEDLHAQLTEKAAENDEDLMEIFFDKGELTEDEIRKGITLGLINSGIIPALCVSAKKNYGVGRMMEFFSTVFPSPNEVPAPIDVASGNPVPCDAAGPAAAFIFKSAVEQHLGEVNYFKVMSGEMIESMDVVNSKTGNKDRISQLFAVAGKNRTKVPKLVAGDFGQTVKLKSARTGQTLSAAGSGIELAPIDFPEPKFRTAIKAVSDGDEEKLNEALQRLNMEDPTIRVEYSKELKQTIISGQGEQHLNIVKWHLDNIFKIATEFIAPKIPYRETITKTAQADYRHKKQSGGAGQFGEVHMIVEPYAEDMPDPSMFKINGKEFKISVRDKQELDMDWGGKLVYYNSIVGGSIDARFMPAILKGIMEKMEEGPLTGSYARDIRVTVYDGKMHPVDSNEISFRLAGRNAFKEAFKNAGPKIMEPIYNVEVWVPADRMGDVMSDLQTRRAVVQGMSSEKGFEKITARVPLAEMNRYSTALSSVTGGRAMYSMKFAEYSQVPGDIQTKLIEAFAAEEKEE